MKKLVFCILAFFAFAIVNSQITDAEKVIKTQTSDSVNGWKKGGIINLGTSQTSLTNWAAGGQSSVSLNGLLNLYAHQKRDNSMWENFLDLGYGTLKQGKTDWWKTDDKIDFTSKYGYKASRSLYLAGLVNFKSQFANGYNYPNDSVKISGFMSPGYLLGAIGLDYLPGENFNLFFAPLTCKMTFVNDQALSDSGSFGLSRGDHLYAEFGSYIRAFLKKDLMENISVQTKLDLFSNYLHNPQNIDVNWEVLLNMKINKFFAATLSTNLVYDDDIIFMLDENDDGVPEPHKKVQFKEVLAIGISYKF